MTPYNAPVLASRFANLLPVDAVMGRKALRGVAQPGRAPRSGFPDPAANPQKTLIVPSVKCAEMVYSAGTYRDGLASSLPVTRTPRSR